MIAPLNTNNFSMLERSMEYLWVNQAAISDNIANAETPNYKAKYVTFEDQFRAQIQAAANIDNKAMSSVMQNATSFVRTAYDESQRSDLNGVDIAVQQLELSRNSYQIEYVFNSMTSDINRIRTAITG
ncbi:MAG: flagellar basal body rod protein FlgB [Eubacteriales bacterium]